MSMHACDRLTSPVVVLENYYYIPLLRNTTAKMLARVLITPSPVRLLDSIPVVRCEYNVLCTFPNVYCPARTHSQILLSFFTFLFLSFIPNLIISISAFCPGCLLDYRTHNVFFIPLSLARLSYREGWPLSP